MSVLVQVVYLSWVFLLVLLLLVHTKGPTSISDVSVSGKRLSEHGLLGPTFVDYPVQGDIPVINVKHVLTKEHVMRKDNTREP